MHTPKHPERTVLTLLTLHLNLSNTFATIRSGLGKAGIIGSGHCYLILHQQLPNLDRKSQLSHWLQVSLPAASPVLAMVLMGVFVIIIFNLLGTVVLIQERMVF
jgi:hypothetical protein